MKGETLHDKQRRKIREKDAKVFERDFISNPDETAKETPKKFKGITTSLIDHEARLLALYKIQHDEWYLTRDLLALSVINLIGLFVLGVLLP